MTDTDDVGVQTGAGPHAGLIWLVDHLETTLKYLVEDRDGLEIVPRDLRERARAAYADGMAEEFNRLRDLISEAGPDHPGLTARGLTGPHLELKLWFIRSHLLTGLGAVFADVFRRPPLTVTGVSDGDKNRRIRRWFAEHLERIDIAFESLLKAFHFDGASDEFKQVLESALRWA